MILESITRFLSVMNAMVEVDFVDYTVWGRLCRDWWKNQRFKARFQHFQYEDLFDILIFENFFVWRLVCFRVTQWRVKSVDEFAWKIRFDSQFWFGPFNLVHICFHFGLGLDNLWFVQFEFWQFDKSSVVIRLGFGLGSCLPFLSSVGLLILQFLHMRGRYVWMFERFGFGFGVSKIHSQQFGNSSWVF